MITVRFYDKVDKSNQEVTLGPFNWVHFEGWTLYGENPDSSQTEIGYAAGTHGEEAWSIVGRAGEDDLWSKLEILVKE